jgi:hypothetical protein
MLIEKRPTKGVYPDADYNRLPLADNSAGKLLRAVKAINPTGFSASTITTGAECTFHLTSKFEAVNGSSVQKIATTLARSDGLGFSLADANLAPAAGAGNLDACKKLTVTQTDKGFTGSFTCADYAAMQEAGHCAVRLTLKNLLDAGDSPAIIHTVDDLENTTLDLTKQEIADTLVAEQAGNPIRGSTALATVTVTGFDAERLEALERAFDYWMLLSNDTFMNKFVPTVQSITYEGSPPSCDKAGAYATLGGTDIHWCVGGGMEASFIKPDVSPYHQVYRVTTALHETLHNTGANHDKEDEDARGTNWTAIPPCGGTFGQYNAGGTAASGEIAVNFFNCTEDYCYAFKDAAKAEFDNELNYSLDSDPRRFQGLCDTWAKQLGVDLN